MNKGRLAIVGLVGLYFLEVAWHPERWRMLDGVDLLIHEAGHPIFAILGEFMGFAGGTLMQLLIPGAFVFHFLREGKPFHAVLILFWLGQSLLNVSVYAADAQEMELPLFGAGERIHDWNWMLDTLNLLEATPFVAGCFRLIGTGVILTALFLGLYASGVPVPTIPPASKAPRAQAAKPKPTQKQVGSKRSTGFRRRNLD
jgi:hypothetical protein